MSINSINILSEILNSVWSKPYAPETLNYYQKKLTDQIPIKYGLYSYNLDRFLIVDGLDLWAMSETSKLLSSKLALTLCIFNNPVPENFKIENCLCWELNNKESVLAVKQTPTLVFIRSDQDINYTTPPPDFAHDLKGLVKDQEFALFILKATVANRLTDLFFNSNPRLNNVNQNYYLDLFCIQKNDPPLSKALDKTDWPNGFNGKINSILYTSNNINDALTQFANLNTHQIETDLFQYRKAYLNFFFKYLNWEPNHAK